MAKPRKLDKKQKQLLADIIETYLYWKETKKNLIVLFKKAEKLKMPITQIAKAIGISKISVWHRYKGS